MSGLVRALWGVKADPETRKHLNTITNSVKVNQNSRHSYSSPHLSESSSEPSSTGGRSESGGSFWSNKSPFDAQDEPEEVQGFTEVTEPAPMAQDGLSEDDGEYGFIDNVRELDDLRRQVQDMCALVSERDQELLNARGQHLRELSGVQLLSAQSKQQLEAHVMGLKEACARYEQQLMRQQDRVRELENENVALKKGEGDESDANEEKIQNDVQPQTTQETPTPTPDYEGRFGELQNLCATREHELSTAIASLKEEQAAHLITRQQHAQLVREQCEIDEQRRVRLGDTQQLVMNIRDELQRTKESNEALSVRVHELESELASVRRAAIDAVNRVAKTVGSCLTRSALRKVQVEQLRTVTPDRDPIMVKGGNLAGRSPAFKNWNKFLVENTMGVPKLLAHIEKKIGGAEGSVKLRVLRPTTGTSTKRSFERAEEVDLSKTVHEYFERYCADDGCLYLECSAA